MTVAVTPRGRRFEEHLAVSLVVDELDAPLREFVEGFGGAVGLSPRELFSCCGPKQRLEVALQDATLGCLLGPLRPVVEDDDGALYGGSHVDTSVLGIHLREALDGGHIGALHGGFGAVTPTLGGGRTGLQIVELLFDVDDILDDVSAAVVGALDLVSQLVAFGFGLVDARLEFIV